jgi:acetyl esterase/lipase
MVMADRPEVRTAPPAIAAIDLCSLAGSMGAAALRLPFRKPWEGTGGLLRNLGVSTTRELVRSFLGASTSLPIDEFRSIEKVLDTISGTVLRPLARAERIGIERETVGGVPGLWLRPHLGRPEVQMLYLHGGGYIGTSPSMYIAFAARLARTTRCAIFVADYRLAPEFPYPAPVDDAVAVLEALRDEAPDRVLFVAGDSGGGGLTGSLLYECAARGLPGPAGVLLFSPEVSLVLASPSITENAPRDVLPWNIPTSAYLHGTDPRSVAVSAGDVTDWPATFVSYGGDEMFRDPIRALVARLRDAGVDTEAHEQPGAFHVFPVLVPWAASTRETYERAGAFVGRVSGSQAASRTASAS